MCCRPISLMEISAYGLRDVCGLGTLGALDDLKFDWISLLKGSIPVAHDGRVVYEYVRTVVTTDKSIPFGIIEPLYVSFHFAWPPEEHQTTRPGANPRPWRTQTTSCAKCS